MFEIEKCEMCDRPGTTIVTDVEEIDRVPEAPGYRRFRVHGRHARCDVHARPPVRYYLDGTIG